MRKTIKLLLPLLLLCTLLITMTALPTFAADERIEIVGGDSSDTFVDNATDSAVRIEYESDGFGLLLTDIIVYNAGLIIDLPFAAELTLAIIAGVIAAWTLIYILWAVKVFPNGKGFDRVMEPCGKFFYRPFVAGIRATCDKLVKNENKPECFFYWTVLGLGSVHILSRLIFNLLLGSFSFGAQLLIPLFALLLIFLAMGNCSVLKFRFGNLLPALCSVGVLTYLGFQICASFMISYELTVMIWISRVAMMALALFFLGLLVNQWVPEIVGSTIMQAGGALYLVFAGTRFLVDLYTVPGTFFSDLYMISLVPLFYFLYRDLHHTFAKKAVEAAPADEEIPADVAPTDEAIDTVAEAVDTLTFEEADETPVVPATEEAPTEA